MEVIFSIVYVISSLGVGLVWIWSATVMTPYIKEGKSFALAFTYFWIFNPQWFTEEGQTAFKKERKLLVSVTLFSVILFYCAFRMGAK